MGLAGIRDYFFPMNPVTERREIHLIPSRLEKFVGASSYAPLIAKSGGEITERHSDEKYQSYVRLVKEVGQQLAAHAKRKDLEFEFTVIDSSENNAWCLPGGKIGINVGLIEKMDTEEVLDASLPQLSLNEKIAAVLSHEIVHADARHTGRALEFRLFLIGIIKATQIYFISRLVNRQYYDAKIAEARQLGDRSRITQLSAELDTKTKTYSYLFDVLSSWLLSGITLCSSRSHELESDRFGMRMIRDVAKAEVEGFIDTSPQAAIWLQLFFEKHHEHENSYFKSIKNFFSTHPSPEVRLAANRQTWEDLQAEKL